MSFAAFKRDLSAAADPRRAQTLARFFKTGPGQYGAGDRFRGITMPALRALVRRHEKSVTLEQCRSLLDSPWHEDRMAALLVMTHHFKRGGLDARQAIVETYLSSTARINNWDLVDLSAPLILGPWLAARDRSILGRLARSESLWERRIAMLATLAFIRARDFDDALAIAEILLDDEHDLIHKAAGWMLREIGKRDQGRLCGFLDRHAAVMPRTMLRYALERLSPEQKRDYMQRTSRMMPRTGHRHLK